MAVVHPRLEPEEFDALQATYGEMPLEYLDGQAVVTPLPGGFHGASTVACIRAVSDWQRATGDEGLLLNDTLNLIGEDRLGPDVAYWSAARRPELTRRRMETVPDLVVEVASPSTQRNDEGPKRAAYLAAGVREQWLVDPSARRIVLVDAQGRETRLDADATLASAVLTGFAAPVSTLIGR